ncbi:MAG TPA: replication factor C small subunit [candidate division Zixibacteria bacterium]|nr:replication factor C small subunit [candidate division Zixibacteria bacterium]
MLWAEKYRPRFLKDLINQQEIKNRLQGFIEADTMPHLLFAGPPGTGKTTAALVLINEILGDFDVFGRKEDQIQTNVPYLELNASDERGINVVRERIKNFAHLMAINAPFRVIILDEADSMTSDAQHALRRTMEKYSSTCRFILICNYSSKIIEPIQSRCAVFRFSPLNEKDTKKYMQNIIKQEKIAITPEAIEAVIYVSEGDLRRATNILQSTAIVGKEITEDDVYNATGKAQPQEIRKMLKYAITGAFKESRKLLLELLIKQGLSAQDVIKQIHREAINMTDIDDKTKVELIKMIGEVDFRLTEGSNPEIQLTTLLAHLVGLQIQ